MTDDPTKYLTGGEKPSRILAEPAIHGATET
jgi:hypothetical protein